MKEEIKIFLDNINSLSGYSEDNYKRYMTTLGLCLTRLRVFKEEVKNPLLDSWIEMAINEIDREYNIRLKTEFSKINPTRLNTEFLYSRSVVTLVLTNILMNI